MSLSPRQRAMVCESEPLGHGDGCGVELRTGADYAVAKALQARALGHYEQGQWGLSGLYFNNEEGLELRAELLGGGRCPDCGQLFEALDDGRCEGCAHCNEAAFEAMNRKLP